jgi:hypothetical protein
MERAASAEKTIENDRISRGWDRKIEALAFAHQNLEIF